MFKTAIFKFHNPSKKKQALLQKAFRNYHLLYDRLLECIYKKLDDFYNGISYSPKKGGIRYSDKKAAQYLSSQYKGILNAFVLSSGLKDSLCKDLAGNLLSYKELLSQRPNTSYPSLQKFKKHEKDKILKSLYESFKTCTDEETENDLRDAIARQSRQGTKLKPLSFIRCDTTHQNMAFLFKPDKKKYYSLVHILPSSKNKNLNITKDYGLYDVRTGEQYIRRTSTGILFSIETGQRIIDRYLNAKSEPKEGKIVFDSNSNEYYLHLAFEFKPERVETKTSMGIDRGIEAICAFIVIDKDYNMLYKKIYEGKTLKELLKNEEKRMADMQRQGKEYRFKVRKNLAERIIHEATNMAADTALKHKAQVYVENLKPMTDRSKKRKRSAFNKILNRSQYQKFLSTLDYKLEERGLPKAKNVHPAYTSMTCIKCGNIDAANRPKSDEAGNFMQDKFQCTKCRYEDNADINASRTIAIKGVWTYIRKDDKVKKEIEKFQDFLTKYVIAL